MDEERKIKPGYFRTKSRIRPFVTYLKLSKNRYRIHIKPGRAGQKYGRKREILTVEEKDIISFPTEE